MRARAAVEAPASIRAEVLDSARRFKASWVDLARHLSRVKAEDLFEGWGYPNFEAYCTGELHIKRTTALKLVQSYGFLQRREPEALADRSRAERAPSFEVLEVLSRAEDRGQLDDEAYAEVRERLWERPVEAAEVRRELQKRFPEPEPPPRSDDDTLRRLAATARRLSRELSGHRRVPAAIAERATALAEDVEGLCRD